MYLENNIIIITVAFYFGAELICNAVTAPENKIKDIFNNYKNYRKKAHTFSKILQKDANFKVSAYIDHLLGYSERENPGIYAGGENESREAKEENTTAFRQ